jgi:hypothetical protein
MIIFMERNEPAASRVNNSEVRQSPYSSEMAVVTSFVTMHEIGHSWDLGLNDDAFLENVEGDGEIYSGDTNDETPERLRRDGGTTWSTMRAGWTEMFFMSMKVHIIIFIVSRSY